MSVVIRRADSDPDYAAAGELVAEYLATHPVTIDFQPVQQDVDRPADAYGPPAGAALLAELDGEIVGFVGVRRLAGGVAELKRMYVRPAGRGRGIGRALAVAAIDAARELGYRALRLDTVPQLVAAQSLYESLGFVDIPPYTHNPVPGARFLELSLEV